MPLHPQVFLIVVHLSITMTLAIIGNLLLILVILRGNQVMRRRLSPVQLLLLHTCAADILFALFSLGTEIKILFSYPHFDEGDVLCRLVHYSQMVPLYASPFLLVAIAADRYQAICRPLNNFRRSRYRRPNCLAATAWSLSFLLSIPQLFVWRTAEIKRKDRVFTMCITVYGHSATTTKTFYVIFFNTVAWILPSLLAAFFYYKVCKAVWMSHKPSIAPEITKEEEQSMITQEYIEQLRKKSCGFKRQNSEYDRKRTHTVRLTMTIIGCNFILWAPFCIANIVQALIPDFFSKETIIFFVIFGNLNASVNPWIYIFFNRKHARRALCCSRSQGGGGGGERWETDVQSSRAYRSLPVTTTTVNFSHQGPLPSNKSSMSKMTYRSTDFSMRTLRSENTLILGQQRQPEKVYEEEERMEESEEEDDTVTTGLLSAYGKQYKAGIPPFLLDVSSPVHV